MSWQFTLSFALGILQFWAKLLEKPVLLIIIIPGGGAVPFWRWRVCKAQKTPFFSIAVTHRPHIFYSCMSSHPKTHIFSFNLSLNAPWFEKLAFGKNTMYFTLVILQSSIEKTNHPKTLFFCELLALTRWPQIFLYFSLTECRKSCSHPMTPHFLSLCSHRMPQPVGGRALHPYPLHIWLPPRALYSNLTRSLFLPLSPPPPIVVGQMFLFHFQCTNIGLGSEKCQGVLHKLVITKWCLCPLQYCTLLLVWW